MVWDKLAKLRDKTQAAILKDKTEPYSRRIPAAIKHAKAKLNGAPLYIFTEELSITAGELALAEALWEKCDSDNYNDPQAHDWTPPPALIAFCEKVEKLT